MTLCIPPNRRRTPGDGLRQQNNKTEGSRRSATTRQPSGAPSVRGPNWVTSVIAADVVITLAHRHNENPWSQDEAPIRLVAGTPPHPLLAQCGRKNILVETLNNVINSRRRRRQPLHSLRLLVRYIVQCLHKDVCTPTLCKGGRHLGHV